MAAQEAAEDAALKLAATAQAQLDPSSDGARRPGWSRAADDDAAELQESPFERGSEDSDDDLPPRRVLH
jgi:hypothetical protein